MDISITGLGMWLQVGIQFIAYDKWEHTVAYWVFNILSIKTLHACFREII